MMSLFEPGPEPLPWLGKMVQLGPISGIPQIRFLFILTLFSLYCSEWRLMLCIRILHATSQVWADRLQDGTASVCLVGHTGKSVGEKYTGK